MRSHTSLFRQPSLNAMALMLLLAIQFPHLAHLHSTSADDEPEPKKTQHQTENLKGKVVFLQERAAEKLGIALVKESHKRILGLELENGRWIPLFEDARVQAFRLDARLRNIPLELVVRKYSRTPLVQVLRIFEWKNGKKLEVLYWCEVCAIASLRPGPCACCQDAVELRRMPVENGKSSVSQPIPKTSDAKPGSSDRSDSPS